MGVGVGWMHFYNCAVAVNGGTRLSEWVLYLARLILVSLTEGTANQRRYRLEQLRNNGVQYLALTPCVAFDIFDTPSHYLFCQSQSQSQVKVKESYSNIKVTTELCPRHRCQSESRTSMNGDL